MLVNDGYSYSTGPSTTFDNTTQTNQAATSVTITNKNTSTTTEYHPSEYNAITHANGQTITEILVDTGDPNKKDGGSIDAVYISGKGVLSNIGLTEIENRAKIRI